MTRQKVAQMLKFRSRSTTVKTNAKSTTALFVAPNTYTNHQFYVVFLKHFFEIHVFTNSVPFSAAPNCHRDLIFRRRSNLIKTKLKSTHVTFGRPPTSQQSQYSLGRVAIFASPVRGQLFYGSTYCLPSKRRHVANLYCSPFRVISH